MSLGEPSCTREELKMSSPTNFRRIPSFRRSSFLLLQDEAPPIASKGQGVLANLIHSRSTTNIFSWRDDNDARNEYPARRSRDDDELPILDTPQVRSMRLIGNSNPRYQWERYWRTDEELESLKKPMFVSRPNSPPY